MPEPATADIWAGVLPTTVDLPYRQQGRSPPLYLGAVWENDGDPEHMMFEMWGALCAEAEKHTCMPTSRMATFDEKTVYFRLHVAGRN